MAVNSPECHAVYRQNERFSAKYGFFRPYVHRVIYRYLDCGILHNGFARDDWRDISLDEAVDAVHKAESHGICQRKAVGIRRRNYSLAGFTHMRGIHNRNYTSRNLTDLAIGSTATKPIGVLDIDPDPQDIIALKNSRCLT